MNIKEMGQMVVYITANSRRHLSLHGRMCTCSFYVRVY